jgi:hypothetical protein
MMGRLLLLLLCSQPTLQQQAWCWRQVQQQTACLLVAGAC